MMRDIQTGHDVRVALKQGVDKLARAVGVTMGPKGRNVVLGEPTGSPTITKDGVTVAKAIELPGALERMGARMVKEVATQTSDLAGDGTTTATVLAQAIFQEGLKNVTAGANPMSIKRGIEVGVEAVIEELKRISTPATGRKEIAQVGAISANNDPEMGELIADAMEQVGKDGVITVEEANGLDTTLDIAEGMLFDRGYLSPSFVTNQERMESVLEDVMVLIHDGTISAMKDLLPVLEKASEASRPILIVAEDVEGEALATLVVNRLRGAMRVCAVKAPGFGNSRKQRLSDIAVLTGGRVISKEVGLKLENTRVEDLGRAKRVVVTQDTTTIVGGSGAPHEIQGRIEEIRAAIDTSDSAFEIQELHERLAKLAGGVAVIHVGAATETEMKERKALVEDALHATRAAVEEGIVPGGGVALLRARENLADLVVEDSEEQAGLDILLRSLDRPLRQIADNAGSEGQVVTGRVAAGTGAYGYNAQTDTYEDLIDAGVIDPTKVTRLALQNAASIANLLLMTECVVGELEELEASERGNGEDPVSNVDKKSKRDGVPRRSTKRDRRKGRRDQKNKVR